MQRTVTRQYSKPEDDIKFPMEEALRQPGELTHTPGSGKPYLGRSVWQKLLDNGRRIQLEFIHDVVLANGDSETVSTVWNANIFIMIDETEQGYSNDILWGSFIKCLLTKISNLKCCLFSYYTYVLYTCLFIFVQMSAVDPLSGSCASLIHHSV